VTGIATARHGTIIAPEGVDLAQTVAAIEDDPAARPERESQQDQPQRCR